MLDQIRHRQEEQDSAMHSGIRTVKTLAEQAADAAAAAQQQAQASSPKTPDPAILSLANNNDLNVSTLAREAHKAKHEEPPQDEVVISLR